MSVSFLRHSQWVDPSDFKHRITLIGCGAVGSHVAVAAARMGAHEFSIWDMDKVEDHNLPNQAFNHNHIGMQKVDALADVLHAFNPKIDVITHNERFESSQHKSCLTGPVIMAVDSMSARADITDAISFNLDVPRVYEARLGFDYGEVHCIDPHNLDSLDMWRKQLRKDDEVDEGPCNLRICTTLVGVVSSTLVHMLVVPYASQRRGAAFELPFKTRFLLKDRLVTRHMNLEA